MSKSAQQSAQPSQLDLDVESAESKLTLDEMTRVMDVARTLRKERSIAQRELNREDTIVLLRQKLREAADLAGDPVTDEQIEVAIKQYFDNLHEFETPEPGFQTFLASVYVRRYTITAWTLALAAAALLTWGMWFGGLLPGDRQNELRAQQTYSQTIKVVESIETLSTNPEVTSQAEAARAEAASYRDRGEVSALEQLKSRLLQQESVLNAEYRLMIPNDGLSGIERLVEDTGGVSGSYVIVEAVDSRGQPVPTQVRNAESGQMVTVTKWAEQVPLEVFEQLKADKEADGILDSREFAVKRRGEPELEITLQNGSGVTLERGRQITQW
ncbi:DUF6384 family protein [Aeoliella mucimassa]|uniref:Uncharacterized protein n=1 Tax=Aeoliella mucimassa TaxID=2527972 RepID=A0A518ANF2_9BACT|nr:DUF6384 family protein [Aeoliella mucimassa]QDU56254.1 hypothetical protein Pan181_24620 [Aeoliella mucimassa]